MNLSLRHARLSAAFAHGRNLRPGMGQRQYLLRHQIVGKNYIRSLKQPQHTQRKQIGIPRPRSTTELAALSLAAKQALAKAIDDDIRTGDIIISRKNDATLVVEPGEKWAAFRTARAALAASGTVTLELALAARVTGAGRLQSDARCHEGRPGTRGTLTGLLL